jgi:predicted PurR-regulated permease PerM
MPQRLRFDLVNVALATAVVVLTIQAFSFVDLISHVLLLLVLAVLLATGIEPLVARLRRSGVARGPSVLGIYLVIVALLVAFGFVASQAIGEQASSLTSDLPNLSRRLDDLAAGLPAGPIRDVGTATANGLRPEQIGPLLSSVFTTGALSQLAFVTVTVFETIFAVFTVFVIAYFWLSERLVLRRLVLHSVREEHRTRVLSIWEDVETKLGAWVRGQLLLMLIVGAAQGVGYAVLGLPFALLLAVFAGLAEAIPMVGPYLGTIPAILIALALSPHLALILAGYTVVLHLIESNVLVPRIMERAVGLTPLTVVLALLVGAALGGLIGALLAIPIAAAIQAAVVNLIKASETDAPTVELPGPAAGGRAAQGPHGPTD